MSSNMKPINIQPERTVCPFKRHLSGPLELWGTFIIRCGKFCLAFWMCLYWSQFADRPRHRWFDRLSWGAWKIVIIVVCVTIPCSLVTRKWRQACCSATLVRFLQATWCHDQEDDGMVIGVNTSNVSVKLTNIVLQCQWHAVAQWGEAPDNISCLALAMPADPLLRTRGNEIKSQGREARLWGHTAPQLVQTKRDSRPQGTPLLRTSPHFF